jgi:hypothetical protein
MITGPVPCGLCGEPVEFEMAEGPKIINMEGVSILVIEHGGFRACPSCGKEVALGVKGVAGVMWATIPVSPQAVAAKRGNLVIPAGGLLKPV